MAIQSIVYLILSMIAVFFATYVHLGVVYIDMLYTYLNVTFAPFIVNHWFRNVLLMVALPLCLAAIPAGLYRVIKKKNMPHFVELTWLLWLIFVVSNILIQ